MEVSARTGRVVMAIFAAIIATTGATTLERDASESKACGVCRNFARELQERVQSRQLHGADAAVAEAQALCKTLNAGRALGVACGAHSDMSDLLARVGVLGSTHSGDVVVRAESVPGLCGRTPACLGNITEALPDVQTAENDTNTTIHPKIPRAPAPAPARDASAMDQLINALLRNKTARFEDAITSHLAEAKAGIRREVEALKMRLRQQSMNRDVSFRVKLKKAEEGAAAVGGGFAVAALRATDALVRKFNLSHARITMIDARPATHVVNYMIKATATGRPPQDGVKGDTPLTVARRLHAALATARHDAGAVGELADMLDLNYGVQLNPAPFPFPPAPHEPAAAARCRAMREDTWKFCGLNATAQKRAQFQCTDLCASSFAGYHAACVAPQQGYASGETPDESARLWTQFSDFFLTCKHCPTDRREGVARACGLEPSSRAYPRECTAGCAGTFPEFYQQCLQHEVKYLPAFLQAAAYNFYRKCRHCSLARRRDLMNACEIDAFGPFAQCNDACADAFIAYADECRPQGPGIADFVRRCHGAVAARIEAREREAREKAEAKEAARRAAEAKAEAAKQAAALEAEMRADEDIHLAFHLRSNMSTEASLPAFRTDLKRDFAGALAIESRRLLVTQLGAPPDGMGTHVFLTILRKPSVEEPTSETVFRKIKFAFSNSSSALYRQFRFGPLIDQTFGLLRKTDQKSNVSNATSAPLQVNATAASEDRTPDDEDEEDKDDGALPAHHSRQGGIGKRVEAEALTQSLGSKPNDVNMGGNPAPHSPQPESLPLPAPRHVQVVYESTREAKDARPRFSSVYYYD